jgi:hypothetical protein
MAKDENESLGISPLLVKNLSSSCGLRKPLGRER